MLRSIFVACPLVAPAIVQAQTRRPFTLDQVLKLAARHNPDVLIARAREAEAGVPLTRDNVRAATIDRGCCGSGRSG
jgi:outer membrane protein TolC